MEAVKSLPLVGIAIVALTLMALAFIISLVSRVLNMGKGKEPNADKSETHLEIDVDQDSELPTMGNTEHADRKCDTPDLANEELVAVITAALMASMKQDTECKIKVKSIRRIPNASPVWNLAGRSEYLSNKL